VVSLVGVVLIARPPFLFGDVEGVGVSRAESIVKGGITERVVAVGYGYTMLHMTRGSFILSVSLVGVLGITAACRFRHCPQVALPRQL
jgi:hypothetical protein